MQRQRARSKFEDDPRIDWQVDRCVLRPADLPGKNQMPLSDLGWDGEIFDDEHVEVRSTTSGSSWQIFLVSPLGEKELTWGAYHALDPAFCRWPAFGRAASGPRPAYARHGNADHRRGSSGTGRPACSGLIASRLSTIQSSPRRASARLQ